MAGIGVVHACNLHRSRSRSKEVAVIVNILLYPQAENGRPGFVNARRAQHDFVVVVHNNIVDLYFTNHGSHKFVEITCCELMFRAWSGGNHLELLSTETIRRASDVQEHGGASDISTVRYVRRLFKE